MVLFRRLLLVTAVTALLCATAFVAGFAVREGPSVVPAASGTGAANEPGTDVPTPSRTPAPEPTHTAAPVSVESPLPLEPGIRLLGPGDQGRAVRDLQARLKQIDWFQADVTGTYGDLTESAVRGFQHKRGIPVTGEVDRRTQDRLRAMTARPSVAELHNRANEAGALDPRCRVGRVICIDKTTSTLRWVVDGTVLQTLDTRFGASTTPTREGLFHVYLKDADHVSNLYGSSMPYSMFFVRGQAVHYSSDFAAVGYAGASHGCVNTRDYDGVAQLFDKVRVGDAVVVYWS